MEYKPYNVKSKEIVSKLKVKYIKFYTINLLLLDNSCLLIIFFRKIQAKWLIDDISAGLGRKQLTKIIDYFYPP